MNNIDFTHTGGFPFSTNILDELQKAYSLFNTLGTLAGNYSIISGCNTIGSNVTDGVVCVDGEVFPFKGGLKQTLIIIKEDTENRVFEDGTEKIVIKRRYATFGSGLNAVNWNLFKRPKNTIDITSQLSSLVNRINVLESKTKIIQKGLIVVWKRPLNEIPSGWIEYTPMRGKMPIGLDHSDSTINTIGNMGGSRSKSITKQNLPAEGIDYKDSYMLESVNYGGISGCDVLSTGYTGTHSKGENKRYLHYRNNKTSNIGNGQAMDVTNPYRVVLFIEYIGEHNLITEVPWQI